MYEDEDLQEIHEDIIELNEDISDLRRDLDNISASVEGTGEIVTLNGTAEARFKKPPLPMGNSEQVQYSGKNKIISFKTHNSDFVEYFFDKSINNSFIMSGLSNLTVSGFKVTIKTSNGDINLGYKNIETNKNFSFTFSITTDDLSKIQNSTSTPFIQFWSSNGFAEANFKNVMIRDSSITDDTYEPYTGGEASPNPDYPQEITNVTGDVEVKVQNKNLFDINKLNQVSDYNTYDNSTKLWYTSTVSSYARSIFYLVAGAGHNVDITKVQKVKPNTTYTIKFYNYENTSGYGVIQLYYYDATGKYISKTPDISKATCSNGYTFTTPADCEYIDIIRVDNNGRLIFSSIQLELGSTATDYVEHKEQTFTFPLGNEKLMLGDYLADDGIHHVRGQIVLKGAEWVGVLTEEGKNQFYLELSSGQYAIDRLNENNSLCNFYTSVPRNDVMISNNQIAVNNRYIRIRDDRYQTGNDLRLWIKSQYDNEMPVIIEYILKEEIIVPYTSAQQEVYNAIKQALSYEEQTNISSNTIALFNAKAFRNMNTSIESLQSRIELLKGRS